jgi:hypothetical protein
MVFGCRRSVALVVQASVNLFMRFMHTVRLWKADRNDKTPDQMLWHGNFIIVVANAIPAHILRVRWRPKKMFRRETPTPPTFSLRRYALLFMPMPSVLFFFLYFAPRRV